MNFLALIAFAMIAAAFASSVYSLYIVLKVSSKVADLEDDIREDIPDLRERIEQARSYMYWLKSTADENGIPRGYATFRPRYSERTSISDGRIYDGLERQDGHA
jgi:hypothetical protein